MSGHLWGDWHNDGAVLQLPDAPFVVENEVGQGRVQELPLLGIHREVGNIDARRIALCLVLEDEAAAARRVRLGDSLNIYIYVNIYLYICIHR